VAEGIPADLLAWTDGPARLLTDAIFAAALAVADVVDPAGPAPPAPQVDDLRAVAVSTPQLGWATQAALASVRTCVRPPRWKRRRDRACPGTIGAPGPWS
jgi:hypothetical protein